MAEKFILHKTENLPRGKKSCVRARDEGMSPCWVCDFLETGWAKAFHVFESYLRVVLLTAAEHGKQNEEMFIISFGEPSECIAKTDVRVTQW